MTPAPGETAKAGPLIQIVKTPAMPSCVLKPLSSKVLVRAKHHKHARVGVLTLTARCTQTVLGGLTGKITAGSGKGRRTYALAAPRKALPVNRTVTFTLTLPPKALTLLGHHTRETAAFKLAFTSANGPGAVSATLAALKPQR
jgi:hypothetical protein